MAEHTAVKHSAHVRLAATVELFELHALGATCFLYLYCKGENVQTGPGGVGLTARVCPVHCTCSDAVFN